MKKVFYLTKEGLEKLEEQLEQHVKTRQTVLEDLHSARGQGDLSENSEYLSARLALEQAQAQIVNVEYILTNATIIRKSPGTQQITIGSVVRLEQKNGNIRQLQLVDTVEADPLNGKVSDESPIGRALLGRMPGDKVAIELAGAMTRYTIASVT